MLRVLITLQPQTVQLILKSSREYTIFMTRSRNFGLNNSCHPCLNANRTVHKLEFGDIFYPGYKGRDSCIYTGRIFDSTTIPPRSHPIYNPGLSGTFTHKWASTVSLAAVYTFVFLEVSSTKHSPCKPTFVTFLTKPLGKQGHRCLLQCS